MSQRNRGESMSAWLTHPEGTERKDKSPTDSMEWGDSNSGKHSLRIGFLNVNSFPMHGSNDKNVSLCQMAKEYSLQLLGMVEMNIYWPKIQNTQQLREQVKDWMPRTATVTSCNRHNTKIRKQVGGAALVAMGDIISRKEKNGLIHDTLGRWTGMSFNGKKGKKLRVLSAYRPIRNGHPNGVYQQQVEYYASSGKDVDPIAQFDRDLHSMILDWIDSNDHIIVMIDANDNLARGHTSVCYDNLVKAGLHESILSRHQYLPSPATRTPGTKTIDSIFCSPGITINATGYAPFNGVSDHQLSWVDVSWSSVFSKQKTIQRLAARRLQCDQDRTVRNYVKLLNKLLKAENDILESVQTLNNEISFTMTEEQQKLYNKLDASITRCMLKAEKACRQLYVSGVPYSPELAQHLNLINFWRVTLRKKRGSKTNMRTIIRLQAACKISGEPLHFDTETILAKYKLVLIGYRQFRKTATTSRSTYLDQRIEDLTLTGNISAATVVANIKKREETRMIHHRLGNTLG